MPPVTMAIRIGNHALRTAVAAQVATLGVYLEAEDGEVAAVVVTTNSDCSPAACRALSAGGSRVVVLSALPSPAERDRYAASGAASYLAMNADYGALSRAVRRAAGNA